MSFDIGGLRIGDRQPLFVIAELGLNHGGSLDRALAMIDAAAAAGASAVKVQTFKAEDLVSAQCPTRAKLHGLAFVATPFSSAAVDMLVDIGVDALKIASGDLTYDRLIADAAQTGLPVIMSTGMSTLAETAHAVSVAREAGVTQLALLHCVSAYPVLEGSQNLRAIQTL